MWFVRAKRNKTEIKKLPAPAGKAEAEAMKKSLIKYGWQDVEVFNDNDRTLQVKVNPK